MTTFVLWGTFYELQRKRDNITLFLPRGKGTLQTIFYFLCQVIKGYIYDFSMHQTVAILAIYRKLKAFFLIKKGFFKSAVPNYFFAAPNIWSQLRHCNFLGQSV